MLRDKFQQSLRKVEFVSAFGNDCVSVAPWNPLETCVGMPLRDKLQSKSLRVIKTRIKTRKKDFLYLDSCATSCSASSVSILDDTPLSGERTGEVCPGMCSVVTVDSIVVVLGNSTMELDGWGDGWGDGRLIGSEGHGIGVDSLDCEGKNRY